MVEYAYIVDFTSVVLICLGFRDTGEASEIPLCNRDERVGHDGDQRPYPTPLSIPPQRRFEKVGIFGVSLVT